MVKSCTVVFPAGNCLLTSSDTFAVGYMHSLATNRTENSPIDPSKLHLNTA